MTLLGEHLLWFEIEAENAIKEFVLGAGNALGEAFFNVVGIGHIFV